MMKTTPTGFLRRIGPLALVIVTSAGSAALDLRVAEIPIGTARAHDVVTLLQDDGSSSGLIVLSTGDDDRLSLAGYAEREALWGRDFGLELPDAMRLFDVARIGDHRYLVGYSDGVLQYLDPEDVSFKSLLPVSSLLRGRAHEVVADINVMRDVDKDGRDDVLIPDFEGWQIAVQQKDGTFAAPQRVGPQAVMRLVSDRNLYFHAPEAYLLDHDLDGYDDLAFWDDGRFIVHHRLGGGYAPAGTEMATEFSNVSAGFYELEIGENADNPSGRQGVLGAVRDLDGDDLADAVIFVVEGNGLFGQETRYEVHRGQRSAGELRFETRPSSDVASGGIQFDNRFVDLDGDGQLELIVISVDFGIGTVIRALLSRTISLRLSIYRMVRDAYPDKPNLTRRITATVNLSKGDVFIPAVLAADVSGDGMKDLLVQDGAEELRIFRGTGDAELFEPTPTRLDLTMPADRERIQVVDLDQDGRDELVMLLDEDAAARVAIVRFRD